MALLPGPATGAERATLPMALDRRRGVVEGIGRGLVEGNGVGQLYRARVGERDVEIGLHRRQRAPRMPEQVAERPLAEAGLVIATHRVGTDLDEPSGCVIEGMSNLGVHRPSVAAPLEDGLHRVRYLSPAPSHMANPLRRGKGCWRPTASPYPQADPSAGCAEVAHVGVSARCTVGLT